MKTSIQINVFIRTEMKLHFSFGNESFPFRGYKDFGKKFITSGLVFQLLLPTAALAVDDSWFDSVASEAAATTGVPAIANRQTYPVTNTSTTSSSGGVVEPVRPPANTRSTSSSGYAVNQTPLPEDRDFIGPASPAEEARRNQIYKEGLRRQQSGQYDNRTPYLPNSEQQRIFDEEAAQRAEQGNNNLWGSDQGSSTSDSATHPNEATETDIYGGTGSNATESSTASDTGETGTAQTNETSHNPSTGSSSSNYEHIENHEHVHQTTYGDGWFASTANYGYGSGYGGYGGGSFLDRLARGALSAALGGLYGGGNFRDILGQVVGTAVGLGIGELVGNNIVASALGSAASTAIAGGDLGDVAESAAIGAGLAALDKKFGRSFSSDLYGLGDYGYGHGINHLPVGHDIARGVGNVTNVINGDVNIGSVNVGDVIAAPSQVIGAIPSPTEIIGTIPSPSRLAHEVNDFAQSVSPLPLPPVPSLPRLPLIR